MLQQLNIHFINLIIGLHCSGFGNGLQASTDKEENIFVLSITLVGVLLLVVSIGLVQVRVGGCVFPHIYIVTCFYELITVKSPETYR